MTIQKWLECICLQHGLPLDQAEIFVLKSVKDKMPEAEKHLGDEADPRDGVFVQLQVNLYQDLTGG